MNRREIGDDQDRLDLLKSHIAAGYYNRRDIVEATASAVVRSQALNILLDRYELDHPNDGKDMADDQKLDEIRRRIDDGYYDDANHLAELVEKLIKKFGLE